MTDPVLPALTTDPSPGDHVETGVREESAMGDERLIADVWVAQDNDPAHLDRHWTEVTRRQIAAIRNAGYAIVPLAAIAAERAVGRRDGIEEAAKAAESVGSPVGASDGCGTYALGTSADAARAIRSLLAADDGHDC